MLKMLIAAIGIKAAFSFLLFSIYHSAGYSKTQKVKIHANIP